MIAGLLCISQLFATEPEKEAVIEPFNDFSTARRTGQPYCGCYARTHCFCHQETYAIAGDEVVTTKSGDKTYGVDWFFSSLAERPVKGLAFFALSLVGLEQRQSYPLRIEQVIRPTPKAKISPAESVSEAKRKRGRPKGSKNKDQTQVNLSRELLHIRGMLSALLHTIGETIPLEYLLLDGKAGPQQCDANDPSDGVTFGEQVAL